LRFGYNRGRTGAQVSVGDGRVGVVVATRNRSDELLTTLGHLRALPEKPRVIVVDNGSTDGTREAVSRRFPEVEVVSLADNLGAAARNVGVRRLGTPYVAFSDDDSWWAPEALSRAADLFDAYPRLGLLAARILVGPEERVDPVCAEMQLSPLSHEVYLPGPTVLGFVACAAIVRRTAYLEAGGFEPRTFIGGEEDLLAADLAACGWGLSYVEDVVAHHHPSAVRDARTRRVATVCNDLWFAWLRRPAGTAALHTLRTFAQTFRDADARSGLLQAMRSMPWVLRERRVVPDRVENQLRMLDRERSLRALRG
jgi:N-acetylglucosaminyl-diphospho-decaprenol L-rhamnosyltransferase